MNKREKALEELKRRIREQKARIDPLVLKLAQSAALSRVPDATVDIPVATVPFDRDAAAHIVALFVKGQHNPREFERRLAAFLMKNRQ